MKVAASKKHAFYLFISLLVIGGCSEYRVSDKNLRPAPISDNHRVYYEIFVGSFSDTNNDGIGDIKGIISRMHYLNDGKPNSGKSLGIEGIWLMPVMPSPSYHKYDVKDYCAIDPDYGTMEDFEKLIAECNKRGIKLILDLVLNHTSNEHPWFLNARQAVREGNFDDPYVKYYVISTEMLSDRIMHEFEKAPDGTQYYYEGNFSPDMPELDMDNPLIRNEVTDIVKFWLEKGAGGFRLDAVKFIYINDDSKNIEFLKWFGDECRKIKDDVYIVAENWSDVASIINYYEAVNGFDFSFSGASWGFYYTAKGRQSVTQFALSLELYQRQVLNKNPEAVLNPFIANHDMDRAAEFLDIEDYSMQTAANLYLLSGGSPFIYYGEEIGMKGIRGTRPTDADRRLAMLWGDNDTVKDPVGSTNDKSRQTNGTVKDQLSEKTSLLTHYKTLIRLRRANPEIARGIITALDFSEYSRFGGFVSDFEGSRVGVFHNTGEAEITVDLNDYDEANFTVVRGFAGKGKAALNGSVLTLPGFTSAVLK